MDRPVTLRPRAKLNWAQEPIWTSQRLHPDVPLANMATYARIDGPLEPERLIDAVDRVVAASDALRTVVTEVDGQPHPTVLAEPPRRTELIQLDPREFESWMRERIREPIDISSAVYDSVLLDHGGSWTWWLDIHHIATDATSQGLVFQAVADAYFDRAGELPVSHVEYTREVARHATGSDRWARAKAFWEQRPTTTVPTALYKPDAGTDTHAERIDVDMTSKRQRGLDDLLAGRFRMLSPNLSLTAALATALATYLFRLNGNSTLAIGIPIHHRSTRESKDVIGPLVELFPLDVHVEADDTFATLHERIGRALFTLLGRAEPGTSPRQSFDVVLNVHGATFGSFGDLPTTIRWAHSGHIDDHHRLRVQAFDYDGRGELQIAFDVNHRVADSDHRRRSVGHFGTVLDVMCADPDRQVQSVSITTADEMLLLRHLTDPLPGTPLEMPAPQVLARALRERPETIALRERDCEMTAAELDRRIEDIARRLCARGIGRGDRVGIEMAIGIDAVVAIHGVQRAGAAFVPIDPSYPEKRQDHLRTDSDTVIVIQSLADLDDTAPIDGELPTVGLDDLAYVIYTSGSTGLPKGVPITHLGLAEYLGFARSSYGPDAGATGQQPAGPDGPLVMPLYTSLSFDLTITTLYLPLITGGRMTIHPDGGLPALREIVDDAEATLLKATPSHLELLVRMIDDAHPLRGLIVGGEAFTTELADRLLDALGPTVAIWNEYGPTEAVVGCMLHRYDPDRDPGPDVPIGVPAPGVQLHVLDEVGHPTPIGVDGELFIGRPGLTSGYLGREDLNEAKFVPLPDGSDGVLYRTGDLVRLLDAERLVYRGRCDDQIKVGGVRIEAGEVEAAALAVDGVQRAVAALWAPTSNRAVDQCVRCGLGSDVPDVSIDNAGVCSICHDFDVVAPQAEQWFRTEAELAGELRRARDRSLGDHDVLHLLSGGKDSTYALYRLVGMGARVFAVTLDTGFISEAAKENVRRATSALGVDHEFITVDGMNDIFRDSLQRFSNVCQGCYKTIYTVALRRATDLGISAIVTGLSRGQFFETRLVPGMFRADRFDPDAIDAAVDAARRVYHSTPDAVSANLDTTFLADGSVLDRIEFIDFYRYVDVPLAELYASLEESGTWTRPSDTGRSTNCLINSAGIHVHKMEQAHHNYALPYSWDVRLGHKTRAEALHELDDPIDDDEMAAITSMLAEVGYEPRPREILALWIEPVDGVTLDIEAVRSHLALELPEHGIPHAIDVVERVPLSPNGKVDVAALPDPRGAMTTGESSGRPPKSPTERTVAETWARVLARRDLAADDDFFALGGTSLHALEMIVRLSERLMTHIPEAMPFRHRTISSLAQAIDQLTPTEGGVDQAEPIAWLDRDDRPISAGEEAMLYEWRRDPDDRRYNVARLYRVPSDYDADRFDAAVRAVVAHQPTLRTAYDRHRTVLDVDAAVRFDRQESAARTVADLAAARNEEAFDLVDGPLVTIDHLTSPMDERPGVLIRTHHISSDAGSLDVLWDQIDLAYRGESLPEHSTTYAAHGVWQRTRTADPLEAWPVGPDTVVGELALRTTSSEPDGYVHCKSTVTTSALRRAPGTTPFATALTALAAAVEPFHSDSRFEVSVTSSVRDHPDLSTVVGYFLNPLPLLMSVDRKASGRRAAESVSERLATALSFRAVPFRAIVAAARDAGLPAPTSRVMLAVEDLAEAHLDGRTVEHEILSSGTAVNDLTFFVQIRGERIELGCEYRGASIARSQAEGLLDQFELALHSLVHRPDDPLHDSGVIPAPQQGSTIAEHPPTAPELIRRSIVDHADHVAARSGGDALSYAELDSRARAVAARLRDAGVGPGDRVAVVLERSVGLPAAIWAVWLLGASYVPIDVGQPPTRVRQLITSAGVRAAVTDAKPHAGLADVATVRADPGGHPAPNDGADHEWVESDEAYVIFTSGSTGRPKGVAVSHGNLAWSLAARLEFYDDQVERFLLLSSAGFDSSVAGLFWTLADGGELLIPTEQEVHDVDELLGLIDRRAPTHTLCVPGLYGALLRRSTEPLRSLQTVIVAGDSCPRELVEQHHESEPGRLVNEYGPTEATVWATAHVLDDPRSETVSIGGPIPGVVVEVQRADGTAAPIDTAGELVIAGPTVVEGYAGTDESDETALRRSSIDEANGQRVYRTGDRVVRRADGTLDFLGRLDEQLSVGGIRIEPVEIERALGSISRVRAALVGVRNDQLVSWIEADPDCVPSALRRQLRDRFPATHIPRAITVVGSLPRNRNGKLDRTRLDELPIAEHATPRPRDVTVADDRTVAAVTAAFVEAFDGRSVDPDDDYFDLGGDSLRAVVLVTSLEERMGRRVGIGELVDAPTPRLFAQRFLPDDNASDREGTADVDASALVEWLRRTGSSTPLIVLPPGGGNLLRYAPLVRALDEDIPVVGVRLPGADATTPIVDTISEQAAIMLAALDHSDIEGPYRLLGWSTGGLLAWEIAHTLRERGDDVEVVALVDTVVGGAVIEQPKSPIDKYRELLRDDGLRAVGEEGFGRVLERSQFALARRRYRAARQAGRTPDLRDAERQLGPVIRRASFGYTPVPLDDVPVVFFAASESGTDFTVDPWTEIQGSSESFDIVPLDGVHFMPEERCIIGPNGVTELVAELTRRLV